jgi:hypothetical protein
VATKTHTKSRSSTCLARAYRRKGRSSERIKCEDFRLKKEKGAASIKAPNDDRRDPPIKLDQQLDPSRCRDLRFGDVANQTTRSFHKRKLICKAALKEHAHTPIPG